ncbi:transposase domain-containing protein, partial [Paraburkholderia tropica]|uniref:transposase domain-containing protein n=1 Tax=Paraburkholderia tropica TaxID=92647 RepID=UPI0030182FA2
TNCSRPHRPYPQPADHQRTAPRHHHHASHAREWETGPAEPLTGGGESAAVIYSLIGTARLNGIEPFAYLRTVFERIANHPINRIDELLPWRMMTAEHVEQQAA